MAIKTTSPVLLGGTVAWRTAFPWIPVKSKWAEEPVVFRDSVRFKGLFSLMTGKFSNHTLEQLFMFIPGSLPLKHVDFKINPSLTLLDEDADRTFGDIRTRTISDIMGMEWASSRVVGDVLLTLSQLNVSFAVSAALDADRDRARLRQLRASPKHNPKGGKRNQTRSKTTPTAAERRQAEEDQAARAIVENQKSTIHVFPVVTRSPLHDLAFSLSQQGRWDEPLFDVDPHTLGDTGRNALEQLRTLTAADIIGTPRPEHAPAARIALVLAELDDNQMTLARNMFADTPLLVKDIARDEGVSRQAIYNRMRKIRELFADHISADADLDEFFHVVSSACSTPRPIHEIVNTYPALMARIHELDTPVWRIVERMSQTLKWDGVDGFIVKDGIASPVSKNSLAPSTDKESESPSQLDT